MSHGCRSGLAVDDKADTATGALVSVENYYFCFLPPTALPETRPWAARQPSWKPPWAAATDGRANLSELQTQPGMTTYLSIASVTG